MIELKTSHKYAKTGNNLVKAFEKIIKKGRKPKMFHTDKGTEFINRQFQTFLKKHDIRFFCNVQRNQGIDCRKV
jgi:transposase InsO family protein